jgi:glutathione S-transferase
MTPASPLRLYRFQLSGHSHRAELLISLLRLPVTLIDVNLGEKAQKDPAFLARNAFGQVPVLEDGSVTIADSNAILVYLASRYDERRRWLPTDVASAAQVQRWLSVAAGPLVSGPAAARLVGLFNAGHDLSRAHRIADELFRVMDAHLIERDFVTGSSPTIADVALYTYTAHAPEGHISLAPYRQIRGWLDRMTRLDGFVAMARSEPKYGSISR